MRHRRCYTHKLRGRNPARSRRDSVGYCLRNSSNSCPARSYCARARSPSAPASFFPATSTTPASCAAPLPAPPTAAANIAAPRHLRVQQLRTIHIHHRREHNPLNIGRPPQFRQAIASKDSGIILARQPAGAMPSAKATPAARWACPTCSRSTPCTHSPPVWLEFGEHQMVYCRWNEWNGGRPVAFAGEPDETKTKGRPGYEYRGVAQATKEFDQPFVFQRAKPLTPRMKAQWKRIRKRGRPPVGLGAAKIRISLERGLLHQADICAKRLHLSRSQLIARGIRAVIAAA